MFTDQAGEPSIVGLIICYVRKQLPEQHEDWSRIDELPPLSCHYYEFGCQLFSVEIVDVEVISGFPVKYHCPIVHQPAVAYMMWGEGSSNLAAHSG